MLKKYDLTGKTALITGASGLLGVEHSGALLESGASVVMTDINEKNLQILFQWIEWHPKMSTVVQYNFYVQMPLLTWMDKTL